MLARRVILSLLFEEGVLMRTKRFKADLRYTQAFSWSADADELVLVDTTREDYDRSIFHDVVRRYCKNSGLPMTVGGRIRDMDEAKRLFDLGADRILIGLGGIGLYEEVAKTWGSQALVAGIDYRERAGSNLQESGSRPELFEAIGSGEALDSGVTSACREAESRGAGEILLTSIDRDGSLAGYDLPTLQSCHNVAHVPIIVSGGCGTAQHMREAFEAGAAGACTSNVFHWNEGAVKNFKDYLCKNYSGPVRPAA